ncbi:protein DEK isoform X2 [Betta splendens]|uniref:Protein DEK n=1 Tax=Betta splendens TaxID=158456 RepID=A0A9W2XBN9_BETSP|nr:protein DEK isoform X2 [Betta splendens]
MKSCTSSALGPISVLAAALSPAPQRNRHHEVKNKKVRESVQFTTSCSAAMSEGMDSSAVSEGKVEDQQNTSQEEQSSHNRSSNKISAVGEILEGKRAKKCVERLDLQAPKPKEKLKFGDGSGEKLGDIPRISFQINKMKPADLKPLHAIVFDRPGKIARLKKNLRLFNGFSFDAESEQFIKRREKLLKNTHFTNSKLKVVCGVLDLEKKGTHLDLIDKILNFLIAPKSSGKRVPVKKKRKSKKKLSDDLSTKTKKKSKSKQSSSSSNPKKSKTASKSKAIVMDSSSDDEEEEDEKAGASAEAEGSDADEKQSEKEGEQSDKSEQSEKESEESPKSNSSKGKSVPRKSAVVKRQSTPAKKTGPPKKRARKDLSEESESEVNSEADEKPKRKKSAKPAAKTKKADSSSNSKNTNTEDSSDDDEPLIMMIKKAPSDEQLKETVQSLLKEANLEEMTMKQICQRVYDTFPNHDLTSRKDFIKQTVKSLIT